MPAHGRVLLVAVLTVVVVCVVALGGECEPILNCNPGPSEAQSESWGGVQVLCRQGAAPRPSSL